MDIIKLVYKSYNVTVYHKQGTTDEKIVFLHGGGLDNALVSWQEVIELMGCRYDIFAVDLLGYGGSDKPDIVYSIPMYVDFLYGVIKQLGIEKTKIVGLSLGGGISLGFSLKYPEIVDKLVLTDAWGFVDRMPFHTLCRWFVNSSLNAKSYRWIGKRKSLIRWSLVSTLIGDKNAVSDELVNTLSKLLHEPGCGKAWESLQCYELGKDGATTDLASHLQELKMPVLIINGEKDALVTAKTAIAAGKVITDSQVHIMTGCRHWPQKEKPGEYTDILKAFFIKGNNTKLAE